MKPRGYRHRVSICPRCGHMLNATSDPKDRGAPRPGDFSLCIECGEILRFDRQLRLKPVTPEMIEQLPKSTALELLEQKDRWLAYRSRRAG